MVDGEGLTVTTTLQRTSGRTGIDRRAMLRYLVGATLARGADAGAAVGLLLLARAVRPPLADATATGGLLAAALTAPHLLGPWVARRLDLATDGRRLLAAAFATYGVSLAGAALLLHAALLPPAFVAAVVAGVCGPLLTGGLSSRLSAFAGSDQRSRRRADGWDEVSYGVAATAGPAAVAALAVLATPLAAVLVLGTAATVAGGVTLTLPRDTARRGDGPVLQVRDVLVLLTRRGPLRRVNVGTLCTAFSLGGVPVVAVLLGAHLAPGHATGATLVAAFGVGNLAGGLFLTAVPLRGEPDRCTMRYVALTGLALASCAVAPWYPVAVVTFALAGFAQAPFVTATFAARRQYAPAAARAQVFVSMAALKIAAQAAGTGALGALAGLEPRVLTAAAGAVAVVGAAVMLADRNLPRRVPTSPAR